ncbi:isoprenyl transferase [Chenggangzhangella methanolivorans]|uniref:Isoprenyl transferase n=1 Tax=Chenggangzhangella methanolivorans TaxID=1437009 RepID=A0A9E6UMA7_9HYPH|nr:isoprenyl transferase [Chenggangzhangella methanolivorans]QZN99850.1 isoprenyl transferase [Chenggangzhangella methanolivorans]
MSSTNLQKWTASDLAPDGAGAAPRHVAIIMDGNGRWAAARGLPRVEGHRRGVEALRRAVRAAHELGVRHLTLYSFSAENWSRPVEEVSDLMNLLRLFMRRDLAELHKGEVRVKVIGERAGLPSDILGLLEEAEARTRGNSGLQLVVAFNYGGRQEIVSAVRRIAEAVRDGKLAPEAIDVGVVADHLDTANIPDPDLVIRTSGELRISNFLLWQSAYAEFVFLPLHWPDFDKAAFEEALASFSARQRRYGGRTARAGA